MVGNGSKSLRASVLIISDELEMARVWEFALQHVGLDTSLIGITEDSVQIALEQTPDLVIVEDFNAEAEEIELCRQLRTETVVPILYLTSKQGEAFLLETYKAGADETIPFPISPRLFQAKVQAWLRRTQAIPLAALDEVQVNSFRLIPGQKRLVTAAGEQIRLTSLESRLLFLLMSHPGHVIETENLVERVWGYYGNGDSVLLKNLIYRLRRKIEPSPNAPRHVLTVANIGYKFQSA
jgi:two-component system response regulator MtrA